MHRRTGFAVVTPNLQHLHLARCRPDFAGVLARADLRLPDGMPLLWLAAALGQPLRERVPGFDLVTALLSGGDIRRVHVIGSQPEAIRHLETDPRFAHVCFTADTPVDALDIVSEEGQERAVAGVRDADPELVLVALGAPYQEALVVDVLAPAGIPAIACGGSLDVLAGLRRRAPAAWRRTGFEWAYRAMQEPRRLLPRYTVAGFTFLRVFASEMWRCRVLRR